MRESDMRTAFLVSGEGTTMEAVGKACKLGRVKHIEPVVVISDRYSAPALLRAKALEIPTDVVERQGKSDEEFGNNLHEVLQGYDVRLVFQCGWRSRTPLRVVSAHAHMIFNQHPGSLPAFGGKGMFGARVTCATLAYNWMTDELSPWTASTVHYVSPEYDTGDVISEVPLFLRSHRPIANGLLEYERKELIDETIRVQAQLLPIEHANVIGVLQLFAEGNSVPSRPQQNFVPDANMHVLFEAKACATQLFPNG